MVQYTDTTTETINVGEAPTRGMAYYPVATDDVSVAPTNQFAYGVTTTENIEMGSTLVSLMGLILTHRIDISETLAPTTSYSLTLAQAIRISEVLKRSDQITLTQAVTMAEATTLGMTARVLERLGLSEAVLPATTYALSLTQVMTLTDLLTNFFGLAATDTVNMTAALTPMSRVNPVVSETATITVAPSALLVLRATLVDGVDIVASDALKLLYAPTIAETVEIGAAYISPGSGITTWAVNTRNRAVTEYTNFNFNSFAKMGHKYLGANADGLYELNGDTDDGTSIIAKLRSGQFQIAGSRFSSFKAAYIGMHGASGEVILRLETGSGDVYTYTVTAKDDRTTRVRLGKGLRSRYFVYELETTGQDFDLDTIEFIPIKAARRD